MCIVSRPTILGNTKFNISPFILHWQLMTISYFRIIFHTFKGSVSLYLYCNKNRIYYAYVDYRKKSNTNQQTQEFLKEILRSRKLYALEWVVSCSWDIKMIHTLRPKQINGGVSVFWTYQTCASYARICFPGNIRGPDCAILPFLPSTICAICQNKEKRSESRGKHYSISTEYESTRMPSL